MDIIYITILLFIILIILYLFNIYNDKYKENFIDFSPYILNKKYDYEYIKNKDQEDLQKKLKEWENPFNIHNEGYYNAQLRGTPLVPI